MLKGNLLFMADFIYPATGGAQISTLSILSELSKSNPDLTVRAICWRNDATKQPHSDISFTNFAGIHITMCNHYDLGLITREVKNSDLIFTFDSGARWAIELAKMYSKPVFIGSHFYRNILIPKDNNFMGVLTRPEEDFTPSYEQYLFNLADETYVNSEYLRDVCQKFVGIDPDIIYPYIDVSKISKPCGVGGMIACSNPNWSKGGDFIVDLARETPEETYLCLYGSTSNLKDPRENQIYNNLRKTKNVIVAPFISMEHFYRHVKMTITPSRIDETFGRMVAEACLLGIPCLTSKAGNLPNTAPEGMALDLDVSLWVDKIDKINNNYDLFCKHSLEHSKRYQPQDQVAKFKEKIRRYL